MTCSVHAFHSPVALTTHHHHVVPESWTRLLGFPEGRTVAICPTGHDAIHVVIRSILFKHPVPKIGPSAFALVDEAMAFYRVHKPEFDAMGADANRLTLWSETYRMLREP